MKASIYLIGIYVVPIVISVQYWYQCFICIKNLNYEKTRFPTGLKLQDVTGSKGHDLRHTYARGGLQAYPSVPSADTSKSCNYGNQDVNKVNKYTAGKNNVTPYFAARNAHTLRLVNFLFPPSGYDVPSCLPGCDMLPNYSCGVWVRNALEQC